MGLIFTNKNNKWNNMIFYNLFKHILMCNDNKKNIEDIET